MSLFPRHFNPFHAAFDLAHQLVIPDIHVSVLRLYRVSYIDTLRGPQICAVVLKGLLKVVPEHDAGDQGSDYKAIDRYGELLHNCQKFYPALCRDTIFVKTPQLVSDEVGT